MLSVVAQQNSDILKLGETAIFLFVGSILLCLLMMIGLLWLGWWVTRVQGSVSPYSGKPMKRGEDLSKSTVAEIERFLRRLDPIDNPIFDTSYAAICRETGRVFPDSVNRFGVISLNWNFLNNRYPGKWISWGSLDPVRQADIRSCHDNMEGFQLETNSTQPMPKNVDSYHAMAKPGPLYVDITTKTLMGWQCVPGTTLELLIVQRPFYTHEN